MGTLGSAPRIYPKTYRIYGNHTFLAIDSTTLILRKLPIFEVFIHFVQLSQPYLLPRYQRYTSPPEVTKESDINEVTQLLR
jgi:hypothetical protein